MTTQAEWEASRVKSEDPVASAIAQIDDALVLLANPEGFDKLDHWAQSIASCLNAARHLLDGTHDGPERTKRSHYLAGLREAQRTIGKLIAEVDGRPPPTKIPGPGRDVG